MNCRADLVSARAVYQALFDLQEFWQRIDGDAWILLAEEHYGRIVEPNHLQRSLDLLETIPWDGKFDAWLEERKQESAAMPDHARRRLFDEWFAGAYDEEHSSAA